MSPGDAFEPRAVGRHRLPRRVRRATRRRAPLRYWRGPVLWEFDGRTWSIGSQFLAELRAAASAAAAPTATAWCSSRITATGCSPSRPPRSVPEGARYTRRRADPGAQPVRARMRYEMSSVIAPAARLDEHAGLLRRALLLPQGFNPKSAALAAEWRAGSSERRRGARARPRFPAAGPVQLHARAAAARCGLGGRISLCDEGRASASTSRPRSCS